MIKTFGFYIFPSLRSEMRAKHLYGSIIIYNHVIIEVSTPLSSEKAESATQMINYFITILCLSPLKRY
ncbi:hypothetical protein [Methanococcus aeolicus]|uniref:hypothetical protein n=1 Tax=Methanococcus aeolicus TaxID=42879 RepID=UPI0021CA9F8B|nr:hypothetical protein [Methanococcus aeolicus]UXM84469.1 hypothetical protein N6C89_06940 [Methanococcus aeolicus]